MVESLVVDGVRVIHEPTGLGSTEATLSFGVGVRDETLPTRDVAHMLEHLVMGAARHLPVDINGEVGIEVTRFYAAGSPAGVATFLTTVCTALARPPLDRMSVESGVLTAEDSSTTAPIAGYLLRARYGADGPGLVWLDGPGPGGLTPDHVLDFARTWFSKHNAVLTVTGVLPDRLELPLPSGPAGAHRRTEGRLLDGPFATTYEIPGAGVLIRQPMGDGARLTETVLDILEERIAERCRHLGGMSYEIGREFVHAPRGHRDDIVTVDARDGTERRVAKTVAEALTRLAVDGPTDDELARSIARRLERYAGPDGRTGSALATAIRDLLGVPSVEPADLDRVRATTCEQVRSAVAEALPTAVVYGHDDGEEELAAAGLTVVPACPVVTTVPSGTRYRPGLTARLVFKGARQAVLVRTENGLVGGDSDGPHEVHWDDIAGVERSDDGWVVFGRQGCVIPLHNNAYRGLDEVQAELRRRVDPALFYDETDVSSSAE